MKAKADRMAEVKLIKSMKLSKIIVDKLYPFLYCRMKMSVHGTRFRV